MSRRDLSVRGGARSFCCGARILAGQAPESLALISTGLGAEALLLGETATVLGILVSDLGSHAEPFCGLFSQPSVEGGSWAMSHSWEHASRVGPDASVPDGTPPRVYRRRRHAEPVSAAPAHVVALPLESHSLKDVGREAAPEAERPCIARILVQTHGNHRRAAINLSVCDRV